MLQFLANNLYTGNSSFRFAKEIAKDCFFHSTFKVNFDVSSLFNNILLDEAAPVLKLIYLALILITVKGLILRSFLNLQSDVS